MPVRLRLQAAAAAITLLAVVARAHEHHEDNIPEGEAVSPDPLVRSSS